MGNQSKNSSLASFVFEEALKNMPFRGILWKIFVFVFLILLSFVIWIVSVAFSVLLFFLRILSLILAFGGVMDIMFEKKEGN